MTRLACLCVLAAGAGTAVGQYPNPYTPPPQSYLQNYYNRSTQPLSPYLNLLNNGGNPALNYYYGVRPGTTGPNGLGPVYGSGAQFGAGFMRTTPQGFFQPTPPPVEQEPLPSPDDPKKFTLPSPGTPVVFGNSFGSSRPGITGVGAGPISAGTRPTTTQPSAGTTAGARTQPPSSIPRSR